MISGGINVYPHDIEEVLIQHPAVREVAVFGIPAEPWGEVPVAAVVLQPEAPRDRETLVVFYDEFPRNIAGKILKREMREAYGKRA
ncbi:MAG: hypothetical protein MUD06_15870 [Rhodospirillales bacterium]|nr:hypothetical protein [Rhodospirillales bacterium]